MNMKTTSESAIQGTLRHRLRNILAGLLLAMVLFCLCAVGYVYFFPEQIAHRTVESWRRNAKLTRHEIELAGGYHCVYLEGGAGEPLVLLHGFGADKDNFGPVAYFLGPHFRLIIPDLAGFGEASKAPDADYSPPAQAERIYSLAQALKLGRFHLGGSSMGGQIAIACAAAYTNDVASLWLLAPAGVWTAPASDIFQTIAAGKGNPMLVRNEEEFARLFALVMHKPPHVPVPVLRVLAQMRIQNAALEERIFPLLTNCFVEPMATNLNLPTLIVWGENDRSLHVEGGRILNKALRGSELILLPEIGHLPMIEAPERVAHDYVVFRDKLRLASKMHAMLPTRPRNEVATERPPGLGR